MKNPDYIIRKITSSEDLEKVKYISYNSYDGHFIDEKNESLDEIKSDLLNGIDIFLIEDPSTKKSLGSFRIKYLNGNTIFIKGIAFLKTNRSYHLAMTVWRFLIKYSKKVKRRRILVSTFRYHHKLINLYCRLGFKFVKYESFPDKFYERAFYEYEVE